MRQIRISVLVALVCVLFIGRGFAQIEAPRKGLENPQTTFFANLASFGPNDPRTVAAYVEAHSLLLDTSQSAEDIVGTLLRYQNVVIGSQFDFERSKTILLLNFHLCLAHFGNDRLDLSLSSCQRNTEISEVVDESEAIAIILSHALSSLLLELANRPSEAKIHRAEAIRLSDEWVEPSNDFRPMVDFLTQMPSSNQSDWEMPDFSGLKKAFPEAGLNDRDLAEIEVTLGSQSDKLSSDTLEALRAVSTSSRKRFGMLSKRYLKAKHMELLASNAVLLSAIERKDDPAVEQLLEQYVPELLEFEFASLRSSELSIEDRAQHLLTIESYRWSFGASDLRYLTFLHKFLLGHKLEKVSVANWTPPESVALMQTVSRQVHLLQLRLLQQRRNTEAAYFGRILEYAFSSGRLAPTEIFTPVEANVMESIGRLRSMVADINSDEVGEDLWKSKYLQMRSAFFQHLQVLYNENYDTAANSEESFTNFEIEALRRNGGRAAVVQIATTGSEVHFFVTTAQSGNVHIIKDQAYASLQDLVLVLGNELTAFEDVRSGRPAMVAGPPAASDAQDRLSALYDILFAPIAEIMRDETIDTIYFKSPSDLSRVPFGALFDSSTGKYLIEEYDVRRIAWKTPSFSLGAISSSSIAGFGMSEAALGFAELPGVERELQELLGRNTESWGGPNGSQTYLNAEFTREQFLATLSTRPNIVHLASHFSLLSGEDIGRSHLLLGDGTTLSLTEMVTDPRFAFEGVELLVLSACSTAKIGMGDGLEVEGLASIAQVLGAKTVVATLWDVADESTATLMTKFYDGVRDPEVSAGAALRAAKRFFISSQGAERDYSHPYYWAGFTISGE